MDKIYLDLIIGGFLGFMLYFGIWVLSKYARVEIEGDENGSGREET